MKPEFAETSWLKFISTLFLGIADLKLLNDEWIYFFVFISIVGFLEWTRYDLERALSHQHNAELERQKAAARERQNRILEDVKKKATLKT